MNACEKKIAANKVLFIGFLQESFTRDVLVPRIQISLSDIFSGQTCHF